MNTLKQTGILILVLLFTTCKTPDISIVTIQEQDVNLPNIDIRTYNINEIDQLIENGNKTLINLKQELAELQEKQEEFTKKNIIRDEDQSKRADEQSDLEDKINEYEDYIRRLEIRRSLTSKLTIENHDFLNDLKPNSFKSFLGVNCGDELSKATGLFGNGIIEEGDYEIRAIFKHRGKEVITINCFKNRVIKSIKLSYLEGIDFLRLRSIRDEKYNIIGIKMARVIEAFGNRRPNDVDDEGYSLYHIKYSDNVVGFRNIKEDNFNISEIIVKWDFKDCEYW